MTEHEYPLTLNKSVDITAKETSYQKAEKTKRGKLIINLKGKNINTPLINAVRRVSQVSLPSYAFAKETIKIAKNTSIAINNDMLRLTIGMLPILGIDPKIYYLPDKYWKDVNFIDPERYVHPAEKDYEIFIRVKNDTADFMDITTDNLKVMLDGKEIKPYDKEYPIRIIILKPGEELICNMKAVLSTANGSDDARWMLCPNAWFTKDIGIDLMKDDVDTRAKIREANKEDEETVKDFTLFLRGNGQTNEYNIVIRACKFLLKKLQFIKKEIQNKFDLKEYQIDGQQYDIELVGEDDTIGNLLIYEIQNRNNIKYAGYNRDITLKNITLKITEKNFKSPLKEILESIQICSEKVSHLGAIFTALKDKKFKHDSESSAEEESESSAEEESSAEKEEPEKSNKNVVTKKSKK